MSQKSAKKERKQVKGQTEKVMKEIAKESAPAVAQLVSDTNLVIKEMKESWSLEEKIQFCKWFLDVVTVEEMAETMGMGLKEEGDDAQMEMDFGAEGTDEQAEGDAGEAGEEGTTH